MKGRKTAWWITAVIVAVAAIDLPLAAAGYEFTITAHLRPLPSVFWMVYGVFTGWLLIYQPEFMRDFRDHWPRYWATFCVLWGLCMGHLGWQ